MNVREITINDRTFYVSDCLPAKRYFDVSKMFYHLQDLKIKQNAVIFDVGANIGLYSLSYAILYQNANIFSFEPHPNTFSKLQTSINLNKDLKTRIKIFNIGLSNRNGFLDISIPTSSQHPRYDPEKNILDSELCSIHGEGDHKIKCSFETLDNFCHHNGIKKIDFIKIDVEGHEYEVLEGAEKSIESTKPIICIEYNEITRTLSNYDNESFEKFFRDRGYTIYGLEYGWAHKLKYIKSLSNSNNISDIYCIPEGL
jgi:FkbM family methyltransferase